MNSAGSLDIQSIMFRDTNKDKNNPIFAQRTEQKEGNNARNERACTRVNFGGRIGRI